MPTVPVQTLPDPDHINVRYGQYILDVSHWLYRSEVQPVAKLLVEPDDLMIHRFVPA
jgi:hypothetical protein